MASSAQDYQTWMIPWFWWKSFLSAYADMHQATT